MTESRASRAFERDLRNPHLRDFACPSWDDRRPSGRKRRPAGVGSVVEASGRKRRGSTARVLQTLADVRPMAASAPARAGDTAGRADTTVATLDGSRQHRRYGRLTFRQIIQAIVACVPRSNLRRGRRSASSSAPREVRCAGRCAEHAEGLVRRTARRRRASTLKIANRRHARAAVRVYPPV